MLHLVTCHMTVTFETAGPCHAGLDRDAPARVRYTLDGWLTWADMLIEADEGERAALGEDAAAFVEEALE